MSEPRSHKKKELYQLAIARSDITAALKACDLMIQHVNDIGHDLYQPLFHAIVISYARPFTSNRSFGPLPSEWSKFSNQDFQEMHNELLHARHQFIAHSDEKIRKVHIFPPGASIEAGGLVSGEIGISIDTKAYQILQFESLRRLCYDLGTRIHWRTNELLAELYEGRVLPSERVLLTFDDEL